MQIYNMSKGLLKRPNEIQNKKQIEKKEETIVKYGIYAPYWTHEWTSDYEYFIPKVKKLGFDVLEISCAALVEKYVTDAQLLELKKWQMIMDMI